MSSIRPNSPSSDSFIDGIITLALFNILAGGYSR